MTRQPSATDVLRIADDVLAVDVWPGKGADILGVVDRASGTDVLFHAPWPRRDPRSVPPLGSSGADWLARYAGGWQVLVPNAGPARTVDGVARGYHGEAALLPWTVTDAGPREVTVEVDLITAPLRVVRRLSVAEGALRLHERVHNRSPDPVGFHWVHHPAFGAPFVDEHCTLTTGARTVITDAEAPGTDLPADHVGTFPVLSGRDGSAVDLSVVPAAHSGTARFAALTDFVGGAWFELASPSAGFGVRLEWDARVLPHAWFWQECHATSGFPWFRRVYTVAVEPANVLPGGGPVPGAVGRSRGGGTVLAGDEVVELTLALTRIPLRPVTSTGAVPS